MKKYLFAAACAASLFATPVLAKQVRLASDFTYPPFNYMDADGKPAGFDIEIADALCQQAQLDCTWVSQNWDALIPSLLARKSDVIMASMRITEERKQRILFTHKYYQTPARFVASAEATFSMDQTGLEGKTIGVQQGTIHDRYVTDKFGAIASIKRYTGQDEVYIDMQNGRLDVTFGNADQLMLAFLDKAIGKGFEFKGDAVTDKAYIGEGTALALRKQDQALAEKFNQAIDAIRANGTYDKIAAKYFSFDIYGEDL
ncbi:MULTISPECIES: ABC transporter substrate-binding protein [unclassified Vibrio]|uniref:ABC transporter substrate-binding protein n=1 Tax=unclassified Vibrio TaxID=2614977 RepID=UPI001360BA42|nr:MULTISPECIES: ABC transporter substrate-binding protein [unclassified Vibrio]NAW58553.1 transporter substrate-binding domain-containing protein [Vibrio sp. V36_P2S2PM302]NAX23129.1 transporter substrate-binding domain-containing protein [Vibrio sp. V39_P1S14PM300]NAX26662.1 transporter substrate-binding domain-containing protein [Vibrio sp. V38_P2S17PM301]NAX31242.1 transporter substrate-binding domain-containing protein [Vibrio sp. V37_P2S8PM304]